MVEPGGASTESHLATHSIVILPQLPVRTVIDAFVVVSVSNVFGIVTAGFPSIITPSILACCGLMARWRNLWYKSSVSGRSVVPPCLFCFGIALGWFGIAKMRVHVIRTYFTCTRICLLEQWMSICPRRRVQFVKQI